MVAQAVLTEARPGTPLAYMLAVINDPTADADRRDRLAVCAAQYVHSRAVWMRKPLAMFCFAAAMVGSTPACAQISNDIVKIGVLSDMSSLYSDSTGPGSLIAAQMAAADFNGKVKG